MDGVHRLDEHRCTVGARRCRRVQGLVGGRVAVPAATIAGGGGSLWPGLVWLANNRPQKGRILGWVRH